MTDKEGDKTIREQAVNQLSNHQTTIAARSTVAGMTSPSAQQIPTLALHPTMQYLQQLQAQQLLASLQHQVALPLVLHQPIFYAPTVTTTNPGIPSQPFFLQTASTTATTTTPSVTHPTTVDVNKNAKQGKPIFEPEYERKNYRTKEPFPEKLYRILMDSEKNKTTEIISFSAEGDSVIISDKDRLSDEILGKYFKHAHFPSFQRQLYMYGFEKQPYGIFVFRHPSFHRDRPELLQLCNRRGKEGEEKTETKRVSFPQKLFKAVSEAEANGDESIVSWEKDGTAFRIHKPIAFAEKIVPKYFDHNNMSSVRRQLVYYGFGRELTGVNRGAYYHPYFARGRPDLLYRVRRAYSTTPSTKSGDSESESDKKPTSAEE